MFVLECVEARKDPKEACHGSSHLAHVVLLMTWKKRVTSLPRMKTSRCKKEGGSLSWCTSSAVIVIIGLQFILSVSEVMNLHASRCFWIAPHQKTVGKFGHLNTIERSHPKTLPRWRWMRLHQVQHHRRLGHEWVSNWQGGTLAGGSRNVLEAKPLGCSGYQPQYYDICHQWERKLIFSTVFLDGICWFTGEPVPDIITPHKLPGMLWLCRFCGPGAWSPSCMWMPWGAPFG